MPYVYHLNTKIRLTMLCLSGFDLYSRWVPLLLRLCLMRVIIGREGNWSENCVLVNLKMTIYNTLSSAA